MKKQKQYFKLFYIILNFGLFGQVQMHSKKWYFVKIIFGPGIFTFSESELSHMLFGKLHIVW